MSVIRDIEIDLRTINDLLGTTADDEYITAHQAGSHKLVQLGLRGSQRTVVTCSGYRELSKALTAFVAGVLAGKKHSRDRLATKLKSDH